MSKNIIIQEGHTARAFSDVAKLRTNLSGSGSCTWVPEDETQLVDKRITANGEYNPASDDAYGYGVVTVDIDLPTKSITKNGTYKASSSNKEGWSEVTVNVSATNGKDTDGNNYSITDDGMGGATLSMDDGDYNMTVDETTDPETGEVSPVVTLTTIAKIKFTQTGSYFDGEAIDLSDFTVTAYVDGEEPQDVTDECQFGIADGTILHYGTEYYQTARWHYNGRTYTASTQVEVGQQEGIIYHIEWSWNWISWFGDFHYQDGHVTADFDYTSYWFVCTYNGKYLCSLILKSHANELKYIHDNYVITNKNSGTTASLTNDVMISPGEASPVLQGYDVIDYSHSAVGQSVVESASTREEASQKLQAFIDSINDYNP